MTQHNMLKTFQKFGYYYSVGEVMLNFIQNLWNLVKSSIISDTDKYNEIILIEILKWSCVSFSLSNQALKNIKELKFQKSIYYFCSELFNKDKNNKSENGHSCVDVYYNCSVLSIKSTK